MTPTSIYMVEKIGGGYRRATKKEIHGRIDAGRLQFEGVDGDEAANTVTYWYKLREDEF